MKQTAMQQAIKEIAGLRSSPSDTPNYTQIFNVLENKLEIEKQQIIDAYDYSYGVASFKTGTTPEQYYNETFNK
jgi:hypothetical protein